MTRIVYISNWPYASGLCQSTVLPSIESILAARPELELTLITPETEPVEAARIHGFRHQPVVLKSGKGLVSRVGNFIAYVRAIGAILKTHPDDAVVWARSSPAGMYAYVAWRLWKAPFVVESFEPHADYMVEGGTWSAGGIKARVQRWFEQKQIRHAKLLVTVSSHFRDELLRAGRPSDTVFNIPCGADFSKFKFSEEHRQRIRARLFGEEHPKNRVAIYVGKFGDIYYDDPFFDWVEHRMEEDPLFRLIVLSPMAEHASAQLKKRNIAPSAYHVGSVEHEEVPGYLSAADVGLCFVHQSPSRRYCSPIKVGEYLACGLPVLITKGIGEDSDWIEEHGAGGVVDFDGKCHGPWEVLSNEARHELRKEAQPWKDLAAYAQRYHQMINECLQ